MLLMIFFQQDSALVHLAWNAVKLQRHELSTSLLLIMAFSLAVRPTDFEI